MIHLIVGNTGAGKSTYCQSLTTDRPAIELTIDEWNKILFIPDKKEEDSLEWFLERIERAETLMQSLILQHEFVGVDTLLDLGFSKFSHREKFRSFAHSHNIACKMHYLDIPSEERWKRVQHRNQEKGATYQFEVTREQFDFMEDWFEIPTLSELQDAVIFKL